MQLLAGRARTWNKAAESFADFRQRLQTALDRVSRSVRPGYQRSSIEFPREIQRRGKRGEKKEGNETGPVKNSLLCLENRRSFLKNGILAACRCGTVLLSNRCAGSVGRCNVGKLVTIADHEARSKSEEKPPSCENERARNAAYWFTSGSDEPSVSSVCLLLRSGFPSSLFSSHSYAFPLIPTSHAFTRGTEHQHRSPACSVNAVDTHGSP